MVGCQGAPGLTPGPAASAQHGSAFSESHFQPLRRSGAAFWPRQTDRQTESQSMVSVAFCHRVCTSSSSCPASGGWSCQHSLVTFIRLWFSTSSQCSGQQTLKKGFQVGRGGVSLQEKTPAGVWLPLQDRRGLLGVTLEQPLPLPYTPLPNFTVQECNCCGQSQHEGGDPPLPPGKRCRAFVA